MCNLIDSEQNFDANKPKKVSIFHSFITHNYQSVLMFLIKFKSIIGL